MSDTWIDRYCSGSGHSKRFGCESGVCPPESPLVAIDYIIDLIIHEFISINHSIDAMFLHHHVRKHYHHDIEEIARMNHHRRVPPSGTAKRHLSRVILRMHHEMGLPLSHRQYAEHQGSAVYDAECHRSPFGLSCPTC